MVKMCMYKFFLLLRTPSNMNRQRMNHDKHKLCIKMSPVLSICILLSSLWVIQLDHVLFLPLYKQSQLYQPFLEDPPEPS